MTKQTEVSETLYRNSDKNAFLIRTLETEPDAECHLYNGSAAVYEQRAHNWLFDLEHTGDFAELVKQLEKPVGTIFITDADYIGEVMEYFPKAQSQEYKQFVLESENFVPNMGAVNPDINIVEIDKSWVDYILSLYNSSEFSFREYIEACIELNPSFGALHNGEKAGYVLVHLDGEAGSMVIDPNKRGMGIGKTLMQYMVPAYAAQASMCVGYVLPENTASIRMMEGSCFHSSDKNIAWIYCRNTRKADIL